MASCGSLRHIFENPLPENPSLIESLSSWKPIRSLESIDHSFTELFGELHFRENPEASLPSPLVAEAAASWSSASTSLIDRNLEYQKNEVAPFSSYSTKNSESYSLMNSESLQLCTEGLGFESLDDVDDLKNDTGNSLSSSRISTMEKAFVREHSPSYMGSDQYKIAKSCGSSYPPPISCIGETGKPWICFKSYREDGRFVLQEVRIPIQEYLHASREDGRLRLCLIQPPSDGDDLVKQEEDDEEEENGVKKDDRYHGCNGDREGEEFDTRKGYDKGNS